MSIKCLLFECIFTTAKCDQPAFSSAVPIAYANFILAESALKYVLLFCNFDRYLIDQACLQMRLKVWIK